MIATSAGTRSVRTITASTMVPKGESRRDHLHDDVGRIKRAYGP